MGHFFFDGFGWVNAIVAAFNLLPGLPLDGGRVLRSLIWQLTHDKLKATIAAGWVGRAVAVGVAIYALGSSNNGVGPLAQRGRALPRCCSRSSSGATRALLSRRPRCPRCCRSWTFIG